MKNTGQQYARDSSRSTLGLRAFIGLLGWCAALTASANAQQPPVYNFDDINNVGSQSITSIQRVNQTQTVTAILGGPLTVPGGQGQGLVNVTISSGDTSFAGTFAVQSGSGTSTLTWNQPGPNTGVLHPTGTVTATGWGLCLGGPCAGDNAPTTWSQAFNNATPSLDGGSMLLSESGGALSDTGWFYNAGVDDTATAFTLDLQFNVAPNQNIHALEFDQFQYLKATGGQVSNDTGLFFGTECDTNNFSQNWNVFKDADSPDPSVRGTWVDTGVPCSYIVSSTAFNHLVIAVHRVAGDTSCQSGYPCKYYTITLNGTLLVANFKTDSGPLKTGYAEQTGVFIQLDTNNSCSGCTISEYIDQGRFLASNISWWPAIQQILF